MTDNEFKRIERFNLEVRTVDLTNGILANEAEINEVAKWAKDFIRGEIEESLLPCECGKQSEIIVHAQSSSCGPLVSAKYCCDEFGKEVYRTVLHGLERMGRIWMQKPQ